jgi:hypothetical protein
MSNPDRATMRSLKLRGILLVMVAGLAFMFWMPFVVVTPTGLSWTNYVIYWGAAWAWVVPFGYWLRRHAHFRRLRRAGITLLMLVLWIFLMSSTWVIIRRALLPPVFESEIWGSGSLYLGLDNTCEALSEPAGGVRYICYVPRSDIPQTRDDIEVALGGHVGVERMFMVSRVVAESVVGLPLARTTEVYSGIIPATKLLELNAAEHAAQLTAER